jgi:DNA-directed RNA polymerase subunit RPC12/RpoP
MPEYSLYCEGCNFGFTRTWKFNEYDKKLKNIKCPNCNTNK